jgi:signal transduction histidine kinase
VAWLVPGLAVATSAWGALAVAHGPGRLTTYAGSSDLAAALTIAAGVALGAAGLALALSGSARVGASTLAAAFAWFAPTWVGWEQGPLLVRSLAMMVAGFVAPLLIHSVLAYPTGRAPTPLTRAVVATVYGEAAVVAGLLAVFRDPYYDQYCWANCTGNSLVVRSVPELARGVVMADQLFWVGAAAVVATLCFWRVTTASPPARRALLPVSLPAVLLMLAVAGHAAWHLRRPLEDPAHAGFESLFVGLSAACLALAAGLIWGTTRTRLQHRAVSRIASDLGDAPRPGSLQAALGRAVGDPALRIAYWLPGRGTYVDASGQPVAVPVAAPGRALTTLVRADERVAVVSHAAGAPQVESAMGAAFRLALDNERLQAVALAHLEELRASRARIVETGDLERRRLERDLHDGAQQRLLAASYEIRQAAAGAEALGKTQTAAALSGALEDTLTALDDLRRLAHGLFPAILGEAGLEMALTSLADTSPVIVDTDQVTPGRFPAAVELAAYLLVVEAVDDAISRQASRVSVRAERHGGLLRVVVEDDGTGPLADLVRSADRIGAVGGTLETQAKQRRAEIPCA